MGKIGNNIITSRLSVINKKIKLEDLNLSLKLNTNKFLPLLKRPKKLGNGEDNLAQPSMLRVVETRHTPHMLVISLT